MTDTLALPDAAALLHHHEHTVEAWARAGIIPGHRVGRRWIFLRSELLEWIAGQPGGGIKCSTVAKDRPVGGVGSPSQAARRLARVLARPTKSKRGNGTTGAPQNSGASTDLANVLVLHSPTRRPIG